MFFANWPTAVVFCLLVGLAQSVEAVTYKVVKNDNLSVIAHKLCGSPSAYKQIAADNRLSNPNLIQVGQVLEVRCENNAPVQVAAASSTVRTVTPQHYRTSATMQEVEEYVAEVFGIEEAREYALPIFSGESGLKLQAKGWNCRYRSSRSRTGWESRACRPQDRQKAYSVDCGVAQINVAGQVCPATLYTLEGNIQHAKKMRDARGNWRDWVVYKTNNYKVHRPRYANWSPGSSGVRIARASNTVVDTLRAVQLQQAVDTLRVAVYVPETIEVTVSGRVTLQ